MKTMNKVYVLKSELAQIHTWPQTFDKNDLDTTAPQFVLMNEGKVLMRENPLNFGWLLAMGGLVLYTGVSKS